MFGLLRNLSPSHRRTRREADALLRAVIRIARTEDFYLGGGVADTVTGRFDVLALHVYLVMRALARDESLTALNQAFLDRFFLSIDDSIREMGVTDPGVPRKVRKVAEGFYGRLNAYKAALEEGGFAPLEEAISRNVYAGEVPGEGVTHAFAAYVIGCMGALAIAKSDDLRAGRLHFPQPDFGGAA